MLFLESQKKGQVAIPVGNYFQHLELPLFVFATFNLHHESHAHTHRKSNSFGFNFPQHNRDRLLASLLDTYNRITI